MKFLQSLKKNYARMGKYKLSQDAEEDLIRTHQFGVHTHYVHVDQAQLRQIQIFLYNQCSSPSFLRSR